MVALIFVRLGPGPAFIYCQNYYTGSIASVLAEEKPVLQVY